MHRIVAVLCTAATAVALLGASAVGVHTSP